MRMEFNFEKTNTLVSFYESRPASSNSTAESPVLAVTPDQQAHQNAPPPVHNKVFKIIKEEIETWANTVTTHGIPNISRNRSVFIKVLWLLFFLSSTAYCCYSIVTLIVSYFQYRVLFNLKVIETPPIDFPAVTVCNLNPFDRRYSQYYIDQVLRTNNMSHVSNISLINIDPNMVKNLVRATIASDTNLTEETKRKFGFDINYMLLTCYFNDMPCNASDFVWMYDYEYGNCFTFNGGWDEDGNKVDVRQMSESGSDRSFRLELFLGDEFAQGVYMYQSGARIAIHNQSRVADLVKEGRDASTNYQTSIGIKRTFISKLDYPYSDCIKNIQSLDSFDSDFYKAIFTVLNMSIYTHEECNKLCLQEFIKTACGCIDGRLHNIYNSTVPVCFTLKSLNCIEDSKIEYYSRSTHSCRQCPLECDQVDYDLSITNSRYPTSYYTSYLRFRTNIESKFTNVTLNDNYIQKNIVLFNVFYDDIATTFVNEIAEITSDNLFGNIGGNLGLFVGMSLLSFVEFLEILILVIFVLVKNRQIAIVNIKDKIEIKN